MKFYAGIGSRETPPDVLGLMTSLAIRLDVDGWTLRTGIATGADQAFARGAGSDAEWSLPWGNFEKEFVEEATKGGCPTFLYPGEREFEIAKAYHPAWDRLSQGAKLLHARNVLQVLGPHGFDDEGKESSFVVCWTKDGKASGGTGQAIRIAEAHGIEVRNLHDPKTREAAEQYVKGES